MAFFGLFWMLKRIVHLRTVLDNFFEPCNPGTHWTPIVPACACPMCSRAHDNCPKNDSIKNTCNKFIVIEFNDTFWALHHLKHSNMLKYLKLQQIYQSEWLNWIVPSCFAFLGSSSLSRKFTSPCFHSLSLSLSLTHTHSDTLSHTQFSFFLCTSRFFPLKFCARSYDVKAWSVFYNYWPIKCSPLTIL